MPPRGATDRTTVPSTMPAAPASGTTSLTAAAGTAAPASVWPSDTAVGMAVMTNHAAVLTAPLMPFRKAGVPSRPSIEDRMFGFDGGVEPRRSASVELNESAALNGSASACTPGSVVVVSGAAGCRLAAAASEAAW